MAEPSLQSAPSLADASSRLSAIQTTIAKAMEIPEVAEAARQTRENPETPHLALDVGGRRYVLLHGSLVGSAPSQRLPSPEAR